jgi:hypothetical protein
VPETFDLESAFDDLTRDVTRAAGPGDADRPVRISRRRRVAAGIAAMAVAVTVGVTATQVAGGDPDSSEPGYVDDPADTSPGAARRERLLAMLPPGSMQVSLLDVEAFNGTPGLDFADPDDRALRSFVMSSFLQLQRGPFARLLLPGLVTYAGNGSTDVFLVDRPPGEVTDALVRAGWEDRDGVLVPGDGVPRVTASVAPFVTVVDEGGRALVGIARERRGLPDPGGEPAPPADDLVELGGAVGVAADLGGSPCAFHAASLTSRTQATVLIGPPEGSAPEEVTVDDLTAPEAITAIEAVAPDDALVRAEVSIEDPDALLQLLRRLGLPYSGFC